MEEYEDELIEFFSREADNVKDKLCSKRTGELLSLSLLSSHLWDLAHSLLSVPRPVLRRPPHTSSSSLIHEVSLRAHLWLGDLGSSSPFSFCRLSEFVAPSPEIHTGERMMGEFCHFKVYAGGWGDFLVVRWLRLCTSTALSTSMGWIPGQELRPHMPQGMAKKKKAFDVKNGGWCV